MSGVYETTESLLEDRPDLRDALEELVELDEGGPWGFDETSTDSGPFGEIVSRGIVEKEDGKYRLTDRESTTAALRGDPKPADEAEPSFELPGVRARVASINRDLVVALAGAFAFLFAFRVTTWRSVFRDGNVVLPANDPYHYRYWVDQILAESDGPFDFTYVSDLPEEITVGEPLTYVIGWWFTALLEPTETTGVVLALLPVACALLVGVFVYLIAVWVTEDERIGVASVLALTLFPAHALYSGIGFFDHHALDYVWLSAGAAGMVWLARDLEYRSAGRRGDGPDPVVSHLQQPTTWLVVGLLGVVFAAMMLTWNGAPLLLLGVAVYATVRATSDVRAGHSPLLTAVPLAVALVLGTVLALGPHRAAGWQEPVVVYSPLLVAIGVVGVSATAELVRRAELSPTVHLGAVIAASPVGLLAFRDLFPDVFGRFAERFEHLVGREGIAETQPLFRGEIGILLDPIDQFGWLVFLVLAMLGWVTYRSVADHEPRWLVVCSYAWSFLALTLVQIRFAGELSPFAAVLAGAGLVYLLSVLDLVRQPAVFGSDRERLRFSVNVDEVDARKAGYVGFVVLIVASISLFMVPAMLDNAATGEEEHEVAKWISEDAQTHDGEDYVLSRWGQNRMYNYFVSGESDGYGVARAHYDSVVLGDPDEAYQSRFGYVVVHEKDENFPPEAGYPRLFEAHGSAEGDVDGAAHYRLVHVSSEESLKVFEAVRGAPIVGNVSSSEPFTIETEVTVGDTTFTYERHVEPVEDGAFTVTVAYPGTYEVDGETVTVTEADVRNGTRSRA